MRVQMTNKRRFVPALSISLGATLVGCVAPGEGPEVAEGKRLGNEMVMALSGFHGRNNRYPSSLEELGSRYATMGYERGSGKPTFFYESPTPYRYHLWFRFSGTYCGHHSKDNFGAWSCEGVL